MVVSQAPTQHFCPYQPQGCCTFKMGRKVITCNRSHCAPYISINHRPIKTITDLICELPKLSKKKNITKLAKMTNFIASGEQYHVIEDTKDYLKKYKNRIRKEEQSFSIASRISAYGHFDLDQLHSPYIQGNKLVYCAERQDNVPFEVTCILNSRTQHPLVTYKAFPYAP